MTISPAAVVALAQLTSGTLAAFDRYAALTEQRIEQELTGRSLALAGSARGATRPEPGTRS